MNSVDTAIVLVTALSCLFGLWRGLVKEVLSLLTWIAALLVARVYSENLSSTLVNVIDSSSMRYVTAFVLLFVAVMMLGTALNFALSKLLKISGLKLADRLFGGIFGVARGVVIVLVIMLITGVFVSETESWQQSRLIPYGVAMIEWSRTLIGDLDSVSLQQGMPQGL